MMRFVQFPDGAQVRAAALSDRRERDDWRQFGLYLDPAWCPSWPADIIDWKDFGLPKSPAQAAKQIRAAFERVKGGERVEVGCKGGLGRTGTVLACMAVLAGVPTEEAVGWVCRTSWSSGTRGRIRGIRIVMPRIGVSGSRLASMHHLKKVFRARK